MTTSRNSSLKSNKSSKHKNDDINKCGEDPLILPQHPQKALKNTNVGGYRIQCWAHTKKGSRCAMMVSSREGEPVPIPYCKVHMKSGDGALKVVKHPIAGKCLVAR